jgi:hypothetical protein
MVESKSYQLKISGSEISKEGFRGKKNGPERVSEQEFHILRMKNYESQIENLKATIDRGTLIKYHFDRTLGERVPFHIPLTERQLEERRKNLEILEYYFDAYSQKIPGLHIPNY